MSSTATQPRLPRADQLIPNQVSDSGERISFGRAWNLPWAELAACRDHPVYAPDDWFPSSKDPEDSEGVRDVCMYECPVQQLCLAAAMRSNQVGGIWGGFDENERRSFHRRQANKLRRLAQRNSEDT